jgi:stage III sporulation protein SpoIIIAA
MSHASEHFDKLAIYIRDVHNGLMPSNSLGKFYEKNPKSRGHISKKTLAECKHPCVKWQSNSPFIDNLLYIAPAIPRSGQSGNLAPFEALRAYVDKVHNGSMGTDGLAAFYKTCPQYKGRVSMKKLNDCKYPYLSWTHNAIMSIRPPVYQQLPPSVLAVPPPSATPLSITAHSSTIPPPLPTDLLDSDTITDDDGGDTEVSTCVDLDAIDNRMLLPNEPVGTTRYITFDSKGIPKLSEEPFSRSQSSMTDRNDTEAGEDLSRMADILPANIKQSFQRFPLHAYTTEIILDIGRRPLVRYMVPPDAEMRDNGLTDRVLCNGELACNPVTMEDLKEICDHDTLGKFTSDNRAGISHTLHRISRKHNRSDEVIALTLRVGRMVPGSTRLISDIVNRHDSVLLLGVPGVGKTTLLREYARVVADQDHRVEIVDTSNEIAGDGDVPHKSVGRARRMMVNVRSEQHAVMIEAVQNHMPDTVIVDEIGTRLEASAAGDIAQRGVKVSHSFDIF